MGSNLGPNCVMAKEVPTVAMSEKLNISIILYYIFCMTLICKTGSFKYNPAFPVLHTINICISNALSSNP